MAGYDSDSWQAQVGALGEQIAISAWANCGYSCRRPDDTFASGASIVDYLACGDNDKFLLEVKTRVDSPFGIENAPCYCLPKSRVEVYKAYTEEKHLPLKLFIVNPEDGKLYCADLSKLTTPVVIDAREFPVEAFSEKLKSTLVYWHKNQFEVFPGKYDPRLMSELRAIYFGQKAKSKYNNAAFSLFEADLLVPESVVILNPPNSDADINVVKFDGYTQFFVKAARVTCAVGYNNPSMSETSPLIEAAKKISANCYRFPVQRLSGGETYGTQAYYFDIKDVPHILAQYRESHYMIRGELQRKRNYQAKELQDWFEHSAIPELFKDEIYNINRAFLESEIDFDMSEAELAKALELKPLWVLNKIINAARVVKAEEITSLAYGINFNRCYGNVDVKLTELEGIAQCFTSLVTPSGNQIDLYKVPGNDKIFADATLAIALGYDKKSGATSDRTGFSKAVFSVAQYYTARKCPYTKARRFVDVADVAAIARKYIFFYTHTEKAADKAAKFLEWWRQQDFANIRDTREKNSLRQRS